MSYGPHLAVRVTARLTLEGAGITITAYYIIIPCCPSDANKLRSHFFMTDLSDKLEGLGLGQYLDSFVTEGFDTWEIVLDITESDL